LNDWCRALAIDGSGNVYAGGTFTEAGGQPVNRIAKWDGTTWSALGSGFNNWCYALAIDGSGNIYAGGGFSQAGGVSANNVAVFAPLPPCDLDITTVNKTDETCDGAADGTITITATCTTCSGIQYSVNGPGGPFQLNDGQFDNLGPGTYQIYVKDAGDDTCNDNATAMAIGTTPDTENPTANCPGNVTENNDNGQCGANVSFTIPNPTDNCTGASSAASPASGTFFNVGTTPVTVTATDAAGNTNTCTFSVIVNDTENPTANCPSNVTENNDNGQCGANVSFTIPNPTDNCTGATSAASPASGTFFNVGTTPVTVTATDAAGNTNTCTFSVIVNDNENPTANCPSTQTVNNDNGQCGSNVSFTIPAPADNCPGATSAASPASGTFFNVGTTPVTVTATDAAGNMNTCTFELVVADSEAPSIVCNYPTVFIQPDGTYTLQESDVYDAANSSDNCSIASVSFPAATFDCDDLDLTIPIMVTVADPSGNTDDCTAMVTVEVGTALPPEWSANDIGNQGDGSDYAYDPCAGNNPSNGDFTISTGGYNLIPQNSDNVAFSSVPLCGNGGIQARIESVTGGYAGLMIRESSAPGAKMVAVYSNLTNLLRREIRTVENGQRSSSTSFAAFPKWLRLVRQGDLIRAFYRSSNGGNWTLFHQAYLPMGNCVEMGLAVFTTDPSGDASAVFGKVNYQSQGGQSLSTPNTLSWEAETPEVQSASVLPNPVRGNFTLQFSKPLSTAGQAALLNKFGQRIAQQPLRAGEKQVNWDAGALPAGLYFLEVATEDGYREVLKVVRQ